MNETFRQELVSTLSNELYLHLTKEEVFSNKQILQDYRFDRIHP